MKKALIFMAISAVLAAAATADNTASTSWLLINSYPEVSAKGPATGAAFFGIVYAGSNPAAISDMENVEFAAMHNVWKMGVTAEKLSVAKNFEAGSFGAEIVYNNLGSELVIDTDQYGNPVMTTDIASLSAWGASIMYAKKIKDFSLGLALKGYSENFGSGAEFAGCVDAGFIYKGFLHDRINLGVSLLNISAGSGDFYTPMDLKAALSFAYVRGGSTVIGVAAGCDYLIKESYFSAQAGFDYYPAEFLAVRGGAAYDTDNTLKFSAGISFKLEGMSAAYSYEPDPLLGDSHKISVSASFGKSSSSSDDEGEGMAISEKGTFASYMESGDYYYGSKQYRKALKYYEYINTLYWKDIEDKPEKSKSAFFQKLGICYYNIKDAKNALLYFERAQYFDKENEILKHWIKSLK